ncbi:hypothetical protein BH18ACT13_BH18ACT13_19670 [soil metagenome]
MSRESRAPTEVVPAVVRLMSNEQAGMRVSGRFDIYEKAVA